MTLTKIQFRISALTTTVRTSVIFIMVCTANKGTTAPHLKTFRTNRQKGEEMWGTRRCWQVSRFLVRLCDRTAFRQRPGEQHTSAAGEQVLAPIKLISN